MRRSRSKPCRKLTARLPHNLSYGYFDYHVVDTRLPVYLVAACYSGLTLGTVYSTVAAGTAANRRNLRTVTNMQIIRNFWNDEGGQDLIEYTLLMAFVALASAALFIGAGGSVSGIWTASSSQLSAANTAAS